MVISQFLIIYKLYLSTFVYVGYNCIGCKVVLNMYLESEDLSYCTLKIAYIDIENSVESLQMYRFERKYRRYHSFPHRSCQHLLLIFLFDTPIPTLFGNHQELLIITEQTFQLRILICIFYFSTDIIQIYFNLYRINDILSRSL